MHFNYLGTGRVWLWSFFFLPQLIASSGSQEPVVPSPKKCFVLVGDAQETDRQIELPPWPHLGQAARTPRLSDLQREPNFALNLSLLHWSFGDFGRGFESSTGRVLFPMGEIVFFLYSQGVEFQYQAAQNGSWHSSRELGTARSNRSVHGTGLERADIGDILLTGPFYAYWLQILHVAYHAIHDQRRTERPSLPIYKGQAASRLIDYDQLFAPLFYFTRDQKEGLLYAFLLGGTENFNSNADWISLNAAKAQVLVRAGIYQGHVAEILLEWNRWYYDLDRSHSDGNRGSFNYSQEVLALIQSVVHSPSYRSNSAPPAPLP